MKLMKLSVMINLSTDMLGNCVIVWRATEKALLKAAKTFLKLSGTNAAFSNAMLAEVGTAAVRTQQLHKKK